MPKPSPPVDIDSPEALRGFVSAYRKPRNRNTPAAPASVRPSQFSQASRDARQARQSKHSGQQPPIDPRLNINHPTQACRVGNGAPFQPSHTGADIVDLADASRTVLYAPNLAANREPRPDVQWKGSVRNPDSIASSITSEPEDVREVMKGQGPPGIWTAVPENNDRETDRVVGDWANSNPSTFTEGEYSDLEDGSFLNRVILEWRSMIPPIGSTFLIEDVPDHWLSDVDTNTGGLLPPIKYPETLPRVADTKFGLDWRRRNWSSTLLGRRRAELDEQKEKKSSTSVHHWAEIPEKKESGWDLPKPVRDPFQKLEKKKDDSPPPHNTLSPRIPSYLRPAQESDMEQIASIYNQEVVEGLQARDSEPLATQNFLNIFQRARALEMPFLVAVYGSVRQSGRPRQENDVLTSCIRDPASRAKPEPELVDKILAFLYLSVWETGLDGSLSGSSRATAQVNLFVHPDFRRRRLGTSLLDKMITTVSSHYFSVQSYDFVDPGVSPMYKPHRDPGESPRRFHKLYATYLVKSKVAGPHDEAKKAEEERYEDDLLGVEQLLVGQFGFEKKARFEMVHRTPKARPGPVQWLDEVVFEYSCMWGFDPLGDVRY